MIPEFEERVAVRISKEERQQIDQLCKEGKFPNKSNVIRKALEEFLASEEKKENENVAA
jgi:Arc/MetJ-type ribon-helix-helix transcriptional regulator